MQCPACSSPQHRVLHTRTGQSKITRLRSCDACGARWTTFEIEAATLNRMEKASAAVRAFSALLREFDDQPSARTSKGDDSETLADS